MTIVVVEYNFHSYANGRTSNHFDPTHRLISPPTKPGGKYKHQVQAPQLLHIWQNGVGWIDAGLQTRDMNADRKP
jgi:hypothetical protein